MNVAAPSKDFMQRLGEQVSHDVMACIGCNDCLLACPLEESRNVTIAELNHAALEETITAANVISFVNACTQCQQCVPVCPADLRRADIVLWNQMKVQTIAPDRVVPLQAGERIVDSEWTVDSLARHLATLPLFEKVDPSAIRRVLLGSTLRRLAPGESIVGEGRYYERLLLVLGGSLEQTAEEASGKRRRLLVLGPGNFHGYMGVLGGTPEPYALSAVVTSTILEFTKPIVLRLMNESGAFRARLEAIYREKAVWTHVSASPLLAAFGEEATERLLDKAELVTLRAGEVLYREGDKAGAIYLVRSGFLRVARRFGASERVLQYFHEGDVCGASAVAFGGGHTATVSANTRAEVVSIPATAVTEALKASPEARRKLIEDVAVSERNLSRSDIRPPSKGRPSEHLLSLEGLVDDGVVQGKEVLIINTAICTDCNNCVDSCERRHGHSRLDRSGLQLGDLLFPTACRHCEDPVCLMCSVNGIVREPDGEIRIVADNCIGCGACAERCPYGNINMHPREKQRRSPLALLSLLGGRETSDIHEAGSKVERLAVKCDLCFGYSDYACVTGCPVGAAMRVDPVSAFGRRDLLVGLEESRPGDLSNA